MLAGLLQRSVADDLDAAQLDVSLDLETTDFVRVDAMRVRGESLAVHEDLKKAAVFETSRPAYAWNGWDKHVKKSLPATCWKLQLQYESFHPSLRKCSFQIIL